MNACMECDSNAGRVLTCVPPVYNNKIDYVLEIRDAPGAFPIPVPRRFEPTRTAVFGNVHAAGGVEGASTTRAVFF